MPERASGRDWRMSRRGAPVQREKFSTDFGGNMAFRVELTARAERDLAAIYEYIQAGSSKQAFLWFNGLEDAILSLEKRPERGRLTRENSRLRQLLAGNKTASLGI